jgi:hypothetical protein
MGREEEVNISRRSARRWSVIRLLIRLFPYVMGSQHLRKGMAGGRTALHKTPCSSRIVDDCTPLAT